MSKIEKIKSVGIHVSVNNLLKIEEEEGRGKKTLGNNEQVVCERNEKGKLACHERTSALRMENFGLKAFCRSQGSKPMTSGSSAKGREGK